jgi:hypothetical protein
MDEPVPPSLGLKDPFTKKDFEPGTTFARALASITLARALNGDKTSQPLAFHYSDGLPRQGIDLTGDLNTLTPMTLEEVVARVKAARGESA